MEKFVWATLGLATLSRVAVIYFATVRRKEARLRPSDVSQSDDVFHQIIVEQLQVTDSRFVGFPQ